MTILSTDIDRTNILRFISILDHQAVGYCELALTNEQAHVATLYSLYVDPAHHHQGYARSLLLTAIEAAQTHTTATGT
jgi:ribosomal protein S18 acetylase RimI-like enzyme